RVSN
ncbi:transposase IS66 family protein, partial [Escherichia coli 96.0932]